MQVLACIMEILQHMHALRYAPVLVNFTPTVLWLLVCCFSAARQDCDTGRRRPAVQVRSRRHFTWVLDMPRVLLHTLIKPAYCSDKSRQALHRASLWKIDQHTPHGHSGSHAASWSIHQLRVQCTCTPVCAYTAAAVLVQASSPQCAPAVLCPGQLLC